MHVTGLMCILDMLYRGIHNHRGYNHRFGMVGAIYGSETIMILKKLEFLFKGLTHVFILHFSILTMLKMTYNFRNCKDRYQFSCYNQ